MAMERGHEDVQLLLQGEEFEDVDSDEDEEAKQSNQAQGGPLKRAGALQSPLKGPKGRPATSR